VPYITIAVVDSSAPGGMFMKGMNPCVNLSGKPGMVQTIQLPPTLGQPPIPLIKPRLPTLHCTTGPQQPSLTIQVREPYLGEPKSPAKSACS